jgi:hypothetical protein
MEEHSTLFVLNGPMLFFSVSQYTSEVIVAPCCMNSTVTPFLSQKTIVISFLIDGICLNFFGLFGEHVCIHYFDCSLVSTFTNEAQVSLPVTHTV